MRKIWAAFLSVGCLVAFAIASSAAAGAEVPTWYECGKSEKIGNSYTGSYDSKSCNAASEVTGGGKYELREGLGKDKEIKGKGGSTALQVNSTLGSVTVECTSSAEHGRPALPNIESGVSFTFGGCGVLGSKSCNTLGARHGEVSIAGLKGAFAETKEVSPTAITVNYESEAHPGTEGVIASLECEGLTATIKGSMTASQTGDVNLISKTFATVNLAAEPRTGPEQSIGTKGAALMVKTSPQETETPHRAVLIGERLEHNNGGDSKQREITPIKFVAAKSGTVEEILFETSYKYEIKETGEHEASSLVLGISEQGKNGKPGKVLGEGTYHGQPGKESIVSVGGLSVPIVKGRIYYLDFLPLGGGISYWYSQAETIIYSVEHNQLTEGNPENYEYQTEAHEAPIGEWAVGTTG